MEEVSPAVHPYADKLMESVVSKRICESLLADEASYGVALYTWRPGTHGSGKCTLQRTFVEVSAGVFALHTTFEGALHLGTYSLSKFEHSF